MATKKTKTAATTASRGEFPNAVEIALADCTVNDAVNARVSERDSDKIEQMATSMIERRAAGQYHQIQPAVVRSADGKTFEILDGGYRFAACTAASEATGEEFPLWAVVVQRSEDAEALVESLQAAVFRTELSPFERAEIVTRLLGMGKTQAQVASVLAVSEATVGQAMRLAKVDKKVRKMCEAGDLEQDAAIVLAGLEADDTVKAEILEEALRHRNKIETLTASIETRKAKAEIEARAERARKQVEEAKILAKESEAKRKEIEKAKDEIVKVAAKTKDVNELIKVRKEVEEKDSAINELAEQQKQAEAAKEKAAKELEKAKKAKEELKAKLAAKTKTTPEDVKRAAKEKGVEAGSAPVSRKDFYAAIEAIGSDKENPVPQSVQDLIGKIEQFLDGDYTDKSLRNMFVLACKDDEQYEKAKLAKRRK